jgi:cullin-associated NEDD8-dissociated protein 1
MTALALELCCTLMGDERSSQSVALAVRNKVLPQALTLIRSSLLQGQALLVILCLCLVENSSLDSDMT